MDLHAAIERFIDDMHIGNPLRSALPAGRAARPTPGGRGCSHPPCGSPRRAQRAQRNIKVMSRGAPLADAHGPEDGAVVVQCGGVESGAAGLVHEQFNVVVHSQVMHGG